MLATLRAKNQITLPGEIIKKLKLKKDDNVDIEVNDSGQIIITPVAIIEKQFITDLKEALDDIEKGNVSEAMSAEEIIKKLGL
ncbi:MAG: AbrB/MazE/SpoVT family DNA-binding domain-containing protein [Clostridiales bacterium]|nr:AbrB/MazE/SpoVT family DNA-binding domain-containing protein [Clostridiales bacterium]